MKRFPHLNGRAEKLAEECGLDPDVAEWLAVVALHSGCFLRSQYRDYSNLEYAHARKVAERLVGSFTKRKLAVEMTDKDLGLLCRVTSKKVYRVLGSADGSHRHRRLTEPPYKYRRLLSLDYVLDYPELPWLPTEEEKLASFGRLGVPRTDLPFREYRGADNVGRTRRYFANKHPIAVDPEAKTAVFVYADSSEPNTKGLRSWRNEHAPLWAALYRQGFRLKIVHAGRDEKLARSVRNVFDGWSGDAASEREIVRMRRDLRRLERALKDNDEQVLDEYGGFTRAFRTAAELQGRLKRKVEVSGYKADYDVWLSSRIPAKGEWRNLLGPRHAEVQEADEEE
ncbi:MAG: hypothetical protein OXH92_01185 [Bryobacterales bacterium]|nr:hypothetical protein [Bryobacterales bacterium]